MMGGKRMDSRLHGNDRKKRGMKSRVVVVRNNSVKWKPDNNIPLLEMLIKTALTSLTGENALSDALRRFFSPDDVVGLKVNCLAGWMLSTSNSLVKVVAEGLRNCGIKEKNIIVWDRECRELRDSGFPLNFGNDGFKCFGTDTDGVGYEDEHFISGEIGSLMSRILTSYISSNISMPILKDHSLAGVTCSMKNFYGAINNPNKYHDTNCNPYVADLCMLPQIRNKNKLIICDALRVQYNGGPAYKPRWIENYGGIIVGTDPVAVDSIGASIIDGLRKKAGLPSLEKSGRPPRYLQTASDVKHKLGISSLKEIELIEMEVS